MAVMALQSVSGMVFTLGFDIGRVCLFLCGECAKINHATGDVDVGAPFTKAPSRGRVNAEKAADVILSSQPLILQIDALRNVTKIFPSVVCAYLVYVVNLVLRPLSGNMQERQSMGAIRLSEYFDDDVFVPHGTCNIANINVAVSGCLSKPPEYTSILIVAKLFSEALCGKIGRSHDVLLALIGQRPRSADNVVAASSFYNLRAQSCQP